MKLAKANFIFILVRCSTPNKTIDKSHKYDILYMKGEYLMARCVGVYIGLVVATFIRFFIFCSELYIMCSSKAMWCYILFCIFTGILTNIIRYINQRIVEAKEAAKYEAMLEAYTEMMIQKKDKKKRKK